MIFVIILLIIVSLALIGIAVVITYVCVTTKSIHNICAYIFTGCRHPPSKHPSESDVRSERAVYELKPLNKIHRSKGIQRPETNGRGGGGGVGSERDFTDICLSAFSSEDEDVAQGDQSFYCQHGRENCDCTDMDSSCEELECYRESPRSRAQKQSLRTMQIVVAPELVGTIV